SFHPCPLKEIIRTGKPVKTTHIETDESGGKKYLEIFASPVKDKEGNVFQIIEVIRDITDRKNLEAQLIHSEKLASIGRLAAGVAHEINNPMASISTCVEGLQKRYKKLEKKEVPEEIKDFPEYLSTIGEAAFRCKSITEKLLRFSRKEHLEMERMNVNQVIEEVLSLIEYEVDQEDKRIVKKLDPELPLITADKAQLGQVFMNFILNGLDAIEGKGELTIRSWYSDKKIFIEFKDTGRGIPEGELSKIFEPFYTTKKVGEGTGLGLFLCHNIVEKHGGKIEVESKVIKGTKFTITLPLK
ncbi:MAG: ATP-binding protein, partial [Fidelibacterota bacterium]